MISDVDPEQEMMKKRGIWSQSRTKNMLMKSGGYLAKHINASDIISTFSRKPKFVRHPLEHKTSTVDV